MPRAHSARLRSTRSSHRWHRWPLCSLYCSLQTSSDGNELMGFTAERSADKSQSVRRRTLDSAHKLAGLSFNRKKKKNTENYTSLFHLHLWISQSTVSQAPSLKARFVFFSGSRVWHSEKVVHSPLTYGSADALWLVCIRSEGWHSSLSVSSEVAVPFKCKRHRWNLC